MLHQLTAAVAALALISTVTVVVSAQESSAIVRATAVEAVREGHDLIRLDIAAENVQNLGAFRFILLFDDSKVSLAENAFDRGAFLGSSGREVFCDNPQVDAGAVRYSCVTLGSSPAEGVDGAGRLVSVYFTPVGDGEAVFEFSRIELATPPGESIPTTATTERITIGGDSTLDWPVIALAAAIGAVTVVVVAAVVLRRRGRRRSAVTSGLRTN